MHMHLYFGVAEIVDYSLNHFSGTHGMSPSEMLCCSVLSSITPGIWPSVSSVTQGEKKILFSFTTKNTRHYYPNRSSHGAKVKNPAPVLFTFFKGLLLPYLKGFAINYFQWYIRVRKEGGSFVHV